MAIDWGAIFRSPENQSAIIQTGGSLLGGMLGGSAVQRRAEWELEQERLNDARRRQFELLNSQQGQENSDFAARQSQGDKADETVLGAMGNSPLQFQGDRMRMNAIADILEAGGPSNLSAHMPSWMQPGGMDMSKFRPSAAAEQPYWDAVANASKGRFKGANLGGIYGDSGADADRAIKGTTDESGNRWVSDWDAHNARTGALQNRSWDMASRDYADAKAGANGSSQKKGSSGWGNAIKAIGLGASMFTGGPKWLSPLIAAGSGVAGSKVGGDSWGGAMGSGIANAALSGALKKLTGSLGGPKFGMERPDDVLKAKGII